MYIIVVVDKHVIHFNKGAVGYQMIVAVLKIPSQQIDFSNFFESHKQIFIMNYGYN